MSVEAQAAEAVEPQITEQTSAAVESTPAPVADAVESSGVDGGHVEASVIDEGLAETARSYGIDPARWQDADALQSAISQFDRAYTHHLSQAQRLTQTQPGQPATPAQQAAAAAKAKLDVKALLPEGDYDDTIRNAFSKMYDDLSSQLSEAQARLAAIDQHDQKFKALEAREQEQQAVQLEARLDGFFGKLGKEWEDLFGKGEMRALSPRSVQAANRNAYVDALHQIQYIDSINGVRANQGSQEKRALHLAFGDQLPTIERRKLAQQANERRNGALSKPASKNGKALDPERAAVAGISEWISKVGAG